MELSKGAKEIITQAQMFRMENNGDELCVEHLLYGILIVGKENDSDGKEIRNIISKEMLNPEAALTQLKKDAEKDNSYFKPAAPILGRATELANGGEIGCKEITKAVFEANTPTICALKGLRAVYEEPAKKPVQIPKPEPTPIAKPVVKPSDKKELNTREQAMLLALLAAAIESQKDELVSNSGHRVNRNKRPNVRRRTKIGPFSYRGGTVSAAIQYFLFGILVPLAVMFAIERFTGFFSNSHSSFVTFIAGTLISLWIFYLARGVSLLFGIFSSAFGNFLDILCDIGLIAVLVRIIQTSWHMTEIPTWLRIIACICTLLVLLVGGALFDHLRDEGDIRKAKFTFMNLQGTPDKIFFQYAIKVIILPFIIFAVIWIFRLTLPNWLVKTFSILGFFYAWNLLNTACACMVMSSERIRGHGLKFVRFMRGYISFLALPAFVLFLHLLFSWSPIKKWVIIVLAIYMVLTIFVSIAYANMD